MVERNHGHIINMAQRQVAGRMPVVTFTVRQAFVRQFSLNLRTDLHGTAVRVTDIEPGLVGGTEFFQCPLKAMTVKAEKPIKYRCIDTRRCQRSRLVVSTLLLTSISIPRK